MKYPINEPNLSNLEKEYVMDVLDSGWLSAGGKHTKKFEKLFAQYVNVNHALAVQSGTAALHLALKAIGASNGDSIILPNYSCGASVSTVVQCGASPVILDIEIDTYGLDVNNLENAILKHRPKAVQLVHVYGFPARDTAKIRQLCDDYSVILIEDACEALGATLNKQKIGTFGDIAAFSIRSDKMIGVGEGGVITTNHCGLFSRIVKLASRSAPFRTKDSPYWEKYFYEGEGYNYCLPHLLGAVARAQIERFPEILIEKRRVGSIYNKIFGENNMWSMQSVINKAKPAYWLNSILFNNTDKRIIRELGQFLYSKGIEVRPGFWPLSDMIGFAPEVFGLQEIGHRIYDNLLVLPSAGSLQEEDINYIYDVICEFIEKGAK